MEAKVAAAPGVGIVLLGAPGTGKSTCAASIADVVPPESVIVLCAKPNEANSIGYVSRGLQTKVFFDYAWRPSLGKYEATGFLELLKEIWRIYDDPTIKAVIVDPYTDVAELLYHELLKRDKAATPRDADDSRSYYGAVRAKMNEFTKALIALQFAPVPKHVIVTCHVQPAKEDGPTQGTKHADKKAKGVQFEGDVLPAFEGSYKYVFAGEFDIVAYTLVEATFDAAAKRKVMRFEIAVGPDKERHGKSRLWKREGAVRLPNDMKKLFAEMEGPQ